MNQKKTWNLPVALVIAICSILLLAVLQSQTALADSTQTIGDFTYKINDETKTAALSKFTSTTATEAEVPSMITVTVDNTAVEYSVTEIGASAFLMKSKLTRIVLPDTITKIGNMAFVRCSSLQTITMSQNVQSIGNSAFQNCLKLTEITLPDSLTTLGTTPFSGCSSLTTVTLGKGITSPETYFSGLTKLQKFIIAEDNPNFVFTDGILYNKDYTKLVMAAPAGISGAVVVPDTVTEIAASAFKLCTSITVVKLGAGVRQISEETFASSSITGIEFSDNLEIIGDAAFSNCRSLTEVKIPSSVKKIGEKAFFSCRAITSIELPDTDIEFGIWTFYDCLALKKINLPNSLKEIPEKMFGADRALEEIVLPENLETIGLGAFLGCALKKITIPSTVTSIGEQAFQNCSSLTAVTLPDGVTEIGASTFNGCTALETVTLPDGVTEIGASIFNGCTALETVTLGKKVTTIGNLAFSGCTALEAILVEEGNESFVSVDGVLFDKDKTTLLAYPGGKAGAYTIPDTVKTLATYSFSYCAGLTEIDFSNVEEMGSRTFQGCSGLKQVVIPASVISISDAFYLCKSLSLAFFKGDVPTFASLAFSNVASEFKILYLEQYTNWAQTDNSYVTKYTREAVANEAAGNAEIFKNQQSDILAKDIYSIQIEDKEAVQAALDVYNALDDAIKDNLTEQKALLDELLDQIAFLESEPVDELIAAIGEVSLDSEAAITRAREAYDALDDAAKAKADGETLTAAETRLAQLKAIEDVEDKIAAITEVTLDSQSVIATAREAYDALEEAIKEEVSNYAVLIKAEASYAKLAAVAEIEKKISAIGTVTLESKDVITAAREAYDALDASLKVKVSNYEVLLTAEEDYAQALANRELADVQESANTELGSYLDLTQYRKTQQSEIAAILTKAKEAIAAAATPADVDTLVADTKKELNAVKTDAQLTKEEKDAKAAEEAKKLAQQKAKFKAAIPTVKAAAAKTYKNIKVSWNKVTDAKGYYVYRKTGKNGTYKKLATVTKTSYTDKTAACGKTYYYTVKAYNADGTSSYNKTGVKAVNNVPAAAKLKTVKAGVKKATVKWSKTTGASGYQVYMATSKKGTYKKVKTLSGKSKVSYIKKSLKKGKTYYFKVRAYKTVSGKKVYGAYSNVKSVKIKK